MLQVIRCASFKTLADELTVGDGCRIIVGSEETAGRTQHLKCFVSMFFWKTEYRALVFRPKAPALHTAPTLISLNFFDNFSDTRCRYVWSELNKEPGSPGRNFRKP